MSVEVLQIIDASGAVIELTQPVQILEIVESTTASVVEIIDSSSPTFLELYDGRPGLSAYDVAVQNGFVGSQAAWLASLQGAAGSGGAWGGITGALSSQTDLQTALNAKVPSTRTVNGHALSADVTVTKGDVGLGSVDNTADASKPVSTLQAAADAAVQAFAIQRGNHTGTQLASTISDFSTAADARITAASLVPTTRTINTHALSANIVLTQDDIASGTTNKAYTATEQTKLAGMATGATANSSDATLLNRANHTGTQLASTISDFSTAADARITAASLVPTTRTVNAKALSSNITLNQDDIASGTTNKAYTATEQTKLAGIATGATANSSDATLLNRANHTGTQLSSTISDFNEATDDRVAALLVQGANVTLTYDDVANTLTIASTGSGGGGTWGSITGTLSSQTDLNTALSGKMATSTYDPASIAQQVVGTTAAQTLTNKTLTAPVISTITNTGTITLPTTTDTLVGRATTDTLTNKTLSAFTITDANNIAIGTTTGTKIGTATSQKIGFFNATPIIQPVATTDLGTVLSGLGLRAAGTAYPITTSGTVSMTGSVTTGLLTSAGQIAATAAISSTTTLTTAQDKVLANATTAPFTVTLPTAIGVTGRQYYIEKIDSSANAVTVATTSAQTIDGSSTQVISIQNGAVWVVSDGANWTQMAAGWKHIHAISDVTSLSTSLAALAPLASPTFTGTVSGITATMVGLGNVDNTSDATKNSATATLTNKTLTSPVINTPTGIVKGDVGLGNVDNTSDATKNSAAVTLTNKTLTAPVISTIVNTGTLTLPTSTDTLVGRATTDTLTNKTLTSPVINTPTGIVKGDVGLGNVDNTSDATKNSASVTLANKTINNTNSATLKTNAFTIQDPTDTTKQGVFSISPLATATTATYTLPDTSDTLLGSLDVATVGLTGSAADLTGVASIERMAAGTIIAVIYSSGWPSNPTSRTDIIFNYIGGTVSTPPTSARVNDLWDYDA